MSKKFFLPLGSRVWTQDSMESQAGQLLSHRLNRLFFVGRAEGGGGGGAGLLMYNIYIYIIYVCVYIYIYINIHMSPAVVSFPLGCRQVVAHCCGRQRVELCVARRWFFCPLAYPKFLKMDILWMDAILDHLQKPWNDDSPVNTNQPRFPIVSEGCGIWSIHSTPPKKMSGYTFGLRRLPQANIPFVWRFGVGCDSWILSTRFGRVTRPEMLFRAFRIGVLVKGAVAQSHRSHGQASQRSTLRSVWVGWGSQKPKSTV